MNLRLYEGSGVIIFLILAIAAIVLLYFFTSIFWPFIVPIIFIFKPLKNMLISGLIGLLLFTYFIVDVEILRLFPSEFYFYSSDAILGENNLVFVRIANNVGLAISIFMIYLFFSERLKRHGYVK
jgi:hypothetical protein